MFWNIAHMKGSSFHTHIAPCPCHFFPLVPHAIRAACRLPCCKIFEIHVLHKALVFFAFLFFLPLFGISIVVRGCHAGGGEYANQNTRGKCLALLGKYPFCSVHAQLAIDFYCKSVRVLCFSAVVVFFERKPFYVEKNCTCVCVGVCVCVFIA